MRVKCVRGFVTCVDYGLGMFPLQRFCGFTARFQQAFYVVDKVYRIKYLPNHNPCGDRGRSSGNGKRASVRSRWRDISKWHLYRLANNVMMNVYTYYRIIWWTNYKEGKPISKPRRINQFQEALHGNSPWCTSPLRVLSGYIDTLKTHKSIRQM
jgi:hypothetical protein